MFHDTGCVWQQQQEFKSCSWYTALVLVVYADSEWYVTVDFWYAAVSLLANGTWYVTHVPLADITLHQYIPILIDILYATVYYC